MQRQVLAGVLVLFAALSAAAQETPAGDRQPFRFSAFWENDSNPLKPNNAHDQHYTNGLSVAVTHEPAFAADVARWMPFNDAFESGGDDTRYGVGYTAGQLMFTPKNLRSQQLIRNDRPYAGYLYLGAFLDRTRNDGPRVATSDRFQLDLGVVGPASQADEVQQGIHELVSEVEPRGWSHQLDNEVTIQATIDKKWRLDLGAMWFDMPRVLELIPQAGLALGTVYRHVEGSATLRAGWNLPDDFGPGRLDDPAVATGDGAGPGWSVYAFGRVAGRIVEHNLLLEGNTFRDSHDVSAEVFTGLATGGVALAYRWDGLTAEVSYSQTYLSDEFKGQGGGDSFGALSISLTCLF